MSRLRHRAERVWATADLARVFGLLPLLPHARGARERYAGVAARRNRLRIDRRDPTSRRTSPPLRPPRGVSISDDQRHLHHAHRVAHTAMRHQADVGVESLLTFGVMSNASVTDFAPASSPRWRRSVFSRDTPERS